MKGSAAMKSDGGVGDEWGTPLDLWAEIREKFFPGIPVILDPTPNLRRILPCTTTIMGDGQARHDALTISWDAMFHPTAPFFCNPPFSDIEKFLAAGISSAAHGGVYLVPVRGDQPWWHSWTRYMEITFIRGRVNYINPATGIKRGSASFASCILRFGPGVKSGVDFWWPRCHQERKKR